MRVRKYLNLLHNLLAYGGVNVCDKDGLFELSWSHSSPHIRDLAYLAYWFLDELERGRLAMAASVARVFISKADMLIGGLFVELPQAATNDGLGYLPSGGYRYGHLYLTSDGSIALTVGDGEGHYAHTAYKWPTLQDALADLRPVRVLDDFGTFYPDED